MWQYFRGAGQKPGTPNKKTNDIIELINIRYPNFNPILSMIKISQDQNIDINIRVSCLKEISNYMFPKRKSVEFQANVKEKDTDNGEISPAIKKMIDKLMQG